jgi:ATP-binding cassette subfamily C protein
MSSLLSGLFSSAGWRAGLALGLAAAVGLTEGIALVLLIPLLALAGVSVEGPVGGIAARLESAFRAISVEPTLVSVLLAYVVLAVLQATLVRARTIADTTAVQMYALSLRSRLYEALTRAEWVAVARMRSSDVTFALTTAVEQVENGASNLLYFIASSLVALVYLAFAVRLSASMSAIVLGVGLLLLVIQRSRVLMGRTGGQLVTSRTQELYATASEQLGGLKTARSYGNEDRHLRLFLDIAGQINSSRMALTKAFANVKWQMSVSSVVALAAILYLGIQVLALPTAAILLLLFLFSRLVPRLVDLQQTYQRMMSATPALDAIEDLVAKCKGSRDQRATGGAAASFDEAIELRDVSFSYDDDGKREQLSSVNLVIPAGGTTAIVGASGAGKSTLADMLLGLIRPAQGEILVDGTNLDAIEPKSWRALIGYVSQDTFLFNNSVRFNLDWAKPGVSEEEMRAALDQAAALDFVTAMPQGLDTIVGERGASLSGGEKQRLGLARALLRRPKLLILDEATSALDPENEERIYKAIQELHGEMTILIITHRHSSLRDADLIHVLESGRVIASGSYDLLRTKDYALPRSED